MLVRRSSGLGLFQRLRTFSTFSEPVKPRKHCAGVHFRHLARETSVPGHFEATWLEKTRLGVTSRPFGSRKLFEETGRKNCSRGLSRHR